MLVLIIYSHLLIISFVSLCMIIIIIRFLLLISFYLLSLLNASMFDLIVSLCSLLSSPSSLTSFSNSMNLSAFGSLILESIVTRQFSILMIPPAILYLINLISLTTLECLDELFRLLTVILFFIFMLTANWTILETNQFFF